MRTKATAKHKPKPKVEFNDRDKALELTAREIEVVRLICQELTAAEIGAKLGISPRTVEAHRYRIMLKIGAKSSIGIFRYALIHGIVSLQQPAHANASSHR